MSTELKLRAPDVFATAAVLVFSMTAVLLYSSTASAAGSKLSPQSDTVTLESLERQVEAAYQRGDTAFLKMTLADDFRFTHGSGMVAGKAQTLANFAQPGNFISRTLTAVDVEVHGDIALTTGRIEVRAAARRNYTVCYVRLYRRRSGHWRLLSHRTFREQAGFTETCDPR